MPSGVGRGTVTVANDDPSGCLERSASDIVYFDPFIERRIDGLEALSAYFHDLAMNWRSVIGNREPQPGDIAMDRANAILMLGAEEPGPLKVPLASIHWPKKLDLLRQATTINSRNLEAESSP